MQNYIFLDTETTGIGENAELLSIAIIDNKGKVLLDTYVTPVATTEWPEAMKVNNLTPAFIFGGNFPTTAELIPVIANILKRKTVVMYGADFDSRFIADALQISKAKTACCMSRFSEYMGVWDEKRCIWKRHRLTIAAELVGHEWTDTPHGALADALATRAVWNFLEENGHVQVL